MTKIAVLDEARLAELANQTLDEGSHAKAADGFCVMEAVAYVAREPHSDSPQCACPVVSAFLRSWNDALNTDDRNRLLKPLIPRLLNTRRTTAVAERRGWLAMDWLIRVYAPEGLALVHDLAPHAAALRELPEIANGASVEVANPAISAAYSAARSAAGSAAYSAAYGAAGSAAGSAARSAADSAAYGAAGSAARSAAYSAAYGAAGSAARSAADSAAYSAAYGAAHSAARSAAYGAAYGAARSAAYSALEPTAKKLQTSALDLVERMLAVTE